MTGQPEMLLKGPGRLSEANSRGEIGRVARTAFKGCRGEIEASAAKAGNKILSVYPSPE